MAGFSIGWCDPNKREFTSNFVLPDLRVKTTSWESKLSNHLEKFLHVLALGFYNSRGDGNAANVGV